MWRQGSRIIVQEIVLWLIIDDSNFVKGYYYFFRVENKWFFCCCFLYTFLIPNKGNLLNYYLLSVSINVEKKKIMFNVFEHKLTQSINPKIFLKISKKKPINNKKKS